MKLTEVGEGRIRGYLFVLDRSLRSFLPRETAADAVREIESHIRERVASAPEPGVRVAVGHAPDARAANGAAEEREALERVLAELGPPLRVAQAYSHEMTLDEAVTTGRFVPMMRAIWHMATTSVVGFLWGSLALCGYVAGAAFLVLAVLKPIFPNNVGFIVGQRGAEAGGGVQIINVPPFSLGAQFPIPPGAHVYGGYWIIPLCIVLGVVVLIATQRGTRRMLAWFRSRKSPATIAFRLEVRER
jgi:uncharacterized membrane protein